MNHSIGIFLSDVHYCTVGFFRGIGESVKLHQALLHTGWKITAVNLHARGKWQLNSPSMPCVEQVRGDHIIPANPVLPQSLQ